MAVDPEGNLPHNFLCISIEEYNELVARANFISPPPSKTYLQHMADESAAKNSTPPTGTKRKHVCPNRYYDEGARGGCFVEIEPGEKEGHANLRVGWSCVIVHDGDIPVSWISEVIAIATASNKDGIAGFLREHGQGGDPNIGHNSYALWIDPAPKKDNE